MPLQCLLPACPYDNAPVVSAVGLSCVLALKCLLTPTLWFAALWRHVLCCAEAVPKKILELMKVDGLTRENVASHLQKYRLYLKRVQQNAPAQGSNGGATAAAAAGGSGAFSSSMGLAAPGMVASNQMMWGNSKQLMDAMQAQQQAAAATVQQAAAGQQSLTLQQQQLMQQQQQQPPQQQQVAQQHALGPDGMGNMLGLMPGGSLMSPVGQLLPGVNMGMGGMPGMCSR